MKQPPLSPTDFARLTGIDTDSGTGTGTLARLEALLALLCRWQTRINLVGPATLDDPWRRHMLDSAQLAPLLPSSTDRGLPSVVDLGSGAGFPGLVLAILTGAPVTLVDSDRRKCAFLIEAARITNARVQILPLRIEAPPGSPPNGGYDVVTARALAPLPKLLALAEKWLAPGGICLFLKGRGVEAELTAAAKDWTMHATCAASRSDPAGVILRIEKVSRRDS